MSFSKRRIFRWIIDTFDTINFWFQDKFNINPLLVCCTYPPDQITKIGHENLSNLIELGFDVIVSGPSPRFWKKILKEGFFKGNYLRGPEIALFSSVPKIAIQYGIRLIIWGESPGYIWNNKKVQRELPYDGNSLKYSNTISGCNLNWSKLFLKKLYLQGLGYKIIECDQNTYSKLKLGHSHYVTISMFLNSDLRAYTHNNSIVIEGSDKVQVGNFASKIRSFKTKELT